MGIGIARIGIVTYPWHYSIWKGIETTGIIAWRVVEAFYQLFKNIFLHGKLGIDVSGPVGIAVITGKVARLGFIYLLQFTALLSINLAIINFLPFPALDGGRVMFFIVEKLRGRAISQKIENAAHMTGFALLMLLVIVVTYKDIMTYGGRLIDWTKGLF
jgi:regulator of sigma E protease